MSPTSRDLRHWNFILVDNPELLKQLASARKHGSSFIGKAQLGIVVLGNPEICDVWIEDCSIASLIIHLSAVSLGLGSCWIQIRARMHDDVSTAEDFVRKVLDVPPPFKVEAMIAIGYASEAKDKKPEPHLPHPQVHYNGFGHEYEI